MQGQLRKGLIRTIRAYNNNNLTSGKYFNKGVKALDAPDLGHVVRETPDKIVVFGDKNERYDIPISEIKQVGANVLIGLPFSEIEKKYKVSRKEPLPTSRKDPWPEKIVWLICLHTKENIRSPFSIKELEQIMKMMLDIY